MQFDLKRFAKELQNALIVANILVMPLRAEALNFVIKEFAIKGFSVTILFFM